MKKGATSFILGVLVGAVAFGGSVAFAAGILATPTANRIFVNGGEIHPEAYMIEGRNYLQLRDIAAAVDFSVVWDGANNRVLIDTSRGYDPNETLPAATPASAMTIDEMKAEIVRLTNAERVKAGLPELEVLPELMDCAQAKAQDFFDSHYYGHDSPVYGTAAEMIKSYVPSARSAGENIAPWKATLTEVFEGWMASPGHRENILRAKYTHIGVGIVQGANGGCWYVQQFVQK